MRANLGLAYDINRHFTVETAVTYFNSKPKVQPTQGADFVRQTDFSLFLNWNFIQWRRHRFSVHGGGGVSLSKAQKHYDHGPFDKSGNGLHFRLGVKYDFRLSQKTSVYLSSFASQYIEMINGVSVGLGYKI